MITSCKITTFLSPQKLGGLPGELTILGRITWLKSRLALISDSQKTGPLDRNKNQPPVPKQSHGSCFPRRNENIRLIRKRPVQAALEAYSSALKTGNNPNTHP